MPTTSPSNPNEKKPKKHRKDKALKRKRHADSSQLSISSPEASKKPRIIADTSSSSNSNTHAQNAATPSSQFHLMTTSLYLSISPRYSFWPEATFSQILNNPDPSARPTSEQAARMLSFTPINGLRKDHLDPLLMSYYEPLEGVVIAYSNIRFESDKARIVAESPFAHVWVTVDFLVWKPKKGEVLQGWVNLQSASHVGLLVENTWNVSIPREKIPESWTYHEFREGFVPKNIGAPLDRSAKGEDEDGGEGMEGIEYASKLGHDTGGWADANGEYVDGLLKFQVESVQAMGHIFSMEGSLLNTETIEKAVLPSNATVKKEKKKKSKDKDRKHKKSKSTA